MGRCRCDTSENRVRNVGEYQFHIKPYYPISHHSPSHQYNTHQYTPFHTTHSHPPLHRLHPAPSLPSSLSHPTPLPPVAHATQHNLQNRPILAREARKTPGFGSLLFWCLTNPATIIAITPVALDVWGAWPVMPQKTRGLTNVASITRQNALV